MTKLAQFYTEEEVSKLLVSQLTSFEPKRLLELGVGSGALIKEAKSKWRNTKIIGCDLDAGSVKTLSNQFPDTQLFVINGLSSKLWKKLNIQIGSVDVAICNPPYYKLSNQKGEYENLLVSSQLGALKNYRYLTSDLVFLAQNLLFLKEQGELGIILPDGLLTNHDFEFFRQQLFRNHDVKAIIQLPNNVFKRTEALTHIVVLRKGSPSSDSVRLAISDAGGTLSEEILVARGDLEYRSDPNYHISLNSDYCTKLTLLDISADICRGTHSKKELDFKQENYVHLPDIYNNESLILPLSNSSKRINTEEGDILMARVGRNMIGKTAMVERGCGVISDCIFRIRVPEAYRIQVWNSLNSEYGKIWLQHRVKGVATKVLSKRDLLNFPIIIKRNKRTSR